MNSENSDSRPSSPSSAGAGIPTALGDLATADNTPSKNEKGEYQPEKPSSEEWNNIDLNELNDRKIIAEIPIQCESIMFQRGEDLTEDQIRKIFTY